MSTEPQPASADHAEVISQAIALLKTWDDEDYQRFTHFVCGYAPNIVQSWHAEYLAGRKADDE